MWDRSCGEYVSSALNAPIAAGPRSFREVGNSDEEFRTVVRWRLIFGPHLVSGFKFGVVLGC